MKRSFFISMVILVIMIIGCYAYGKKVLATVEGEKNPDVVLENENDISLDISDEIHDDFCDEIINDYTDLVDASAIIIKGRVDGNRVMYHSSTDTDFVVDKIYKDDTKSLIDGETIFIVEPFWIHLENSYDSFGYQMLKSGEEYVLFLNPLKCVEGYTYTKKEKISFMPSTQYFSRYCTSMTEKTELLDESQEELWYRDYADNAFFAYDPKVKERYEALAKEVGTELSE